MKPEYFDKFPLTIYLHLAGVSVSVPRLMIMELKAAVRCAMAEPQIAGLNVFHVFH